MKYLSLVNHRLSAPRCPTASATTKPASATPHEQRLGTRQAGHRSNSPARRHNDRVTVDAAAPFESAAHCFADLVETIPSTAWDGPGLGEWDLRSLVGHACRSLITVTTYLARPVPAADIPSAAAYYSWVVQQVGADPAAVAERGKQAGIALGQDPAGAIRVELADALTAVRGVTGDPTIETLAGGMRLSDYLPTRTFELVVHTLDIADALGQEVTIPAAPLADTIRLATELAVQQGDGQSLLLALTGRKALRENYSVL